MTREQSDFGFELVTGTGTATSGHYFGIQVLAAAVISSITFEPDYRGDTDIQGVTLPAGLYRPMRFTTLTLTSGTIICERGS